LTGVDAAPLAVLNSVSNRHRLLGQASTLCSVIIAAAAAGKLFVYEATREGKVANASINIVGNALRHDAVYGLAAYAQATGSAEARTLALNTQNP